MPIDQLHLWLSPWSSQMALFALVLMRISGLLSVGPILGQAILPWPTRVGLAVTLSVLLAPLFSSAETWQFTATGFIPALIAEFGLGFLLGCGVSLILWAVPLASHLLDQQSGFSTADEDSLSSGSATTRWLTLWCAASFVLCSPINGHLRLVISLAESFQTWPLGQTESWLNADFLAGLLQQSCELSLRVLAPGLSALLLVNFALGLLGASGAANVSMSLHGAIRPLVAGVVLLASLSGVNQTVADFVHDGFSAGRIASQSTVEAADGFVR